MRLFLGGASARAARAAGMIFSRPPSSDLGWAASAVCEIMVMSETGAGAVVRAWLYRPPALWQTDALAGSYHGRTRLQRCVRNEKQCNQRERCQGRRCRRVECLSLCRVERQG